MCGVEGWRGQLPVTMWDGGVVSCDCMCVEWRGCGVVTCDYVCSSTCDCVWSGEVVGSYP